MKKIKVYLDTSVINFIFADDAPDFKKATIDFFENYFSLYEVYISDIVLLEIKKTNDSTKREKLLKVVKDYAFILLESDGDERIKNLSNLYIQENIIPKKKFEDALHIAICTVFEMDMLLSWNFKHLANIHKEILINTINEREGYWKKLNLLSPLEAIYDAE
jgi:predicted nucleic acid-binding protein